MSKLSLTFICLIVYDVTFSQLFDTGHYITNSSDTIQAEINIYDNSKDFFIVKSNSLVDTIYAENTQQLLIGDHTKYRSVQSPFKLEVPSDSLWTILIDGRYSLYELENRGNKDFYFSMNEDSRIKLEHKKYGTKSEQDKFRQQIWDSFKCSSITIDYLKEVTYNRVDLKRLFRKLNECSGKIISDENKVIYKRKSYLEERPVFFRELLSSNDLTLLELGYDKNVNYYILNENDSLILLDYSLKYQGNTRIEEKTFINQIRNITKCSNRDISVGYNRKDIISFISKCLKDSETKFAVYDSKPPLNLVDYISLRAKGGFSSNFMDLRVDSREFDLDGMGGNIGVEIEYSPRRLPLIGVVGEVEYTYLKRSSEHNFGDLIFTYPNLNFLIGARFNLLDVNPYKFSITFGQNFVNPLGAKVKFADIPAQYFNESFSRFFLSSQFTLDRIFIEYRRDMANTTSNQEVFDIELTNSKNIFRVGYLIRKL